MIESSVLDPNLKVAGDSDLSNGITEDGIYLGDMWAIVIRRKKTVGKIMLAFLVSAIALAFLLPVEYTSTASFIPPTAAGTGSMAAVLAGQLASFGGGELLGSGKTSGDMYAGILRSRSVTEEVIKRFGLMQQLRAKKQSQAEKMLASATAVTADPKSTIVTISVSAKTPQLAHDIANGYLDALRNTDGRLALTDASQRRLFYEQQIAKEKDDLENAEVELKRTQEQSGLIAPTGQTAVEIRTVADTQAQIAVREVQLAALRQSATEENPDVVRLKSEIQNLQSQLTRLQQGGNSSNSGNIPTAKVPELQLQYVRAEREVKYHEALFEMLSRQYEAARLEEAREGPMLQILDHASMPDSKSSPKRVLIMVLGLIGGIIVGIVWVLLPHLRRSRA
jgi:uncharacterized protein involved in exopolysaccharide biosynthesis